MRGSIVVGLVAVLISSCSVLVDLSILERPPSNDAATDAPTLDVGSDASTTADADATSGSDAADAGCSIFFDDFNRTSDAGIIGNGWTPKQPAFLLGGGGVERVSSSSVDYRDLVVYRPATEDATDLVASVEVKYSAGAKGWPQVHARIQSSTVGLANTLDDYLLFPAGGGSSAMIIARNSGTASFIALIQFALTATLDTTHTYRFSLSVKGESPVSLIGTVERLDAPNWTVIGTQPVSDSSAGQIKSAGSFGFSAGASDVTDQYTYDNFCVHP